jgi:DtxR family Mn-dependent transcriptional regulator
MKRTITEEMAEVLEEVWTLEEKGASIDSLANGSSPPDHLLRILLEDNLIELDNTGRVRLQAAGRAVAEQIIRRHRLAERLICDVLGSHVDESEDAACEFEHLLAEGITNSICTLLGHPRYCPHNRPIPEGECCRQAREELKPIVVSCDQLSIGEAARIAYISTKEHTRITRLSALGITPGALLKLLQKWPTCVIQCEETEIAVEKEVARGIYVWQNPTD